MVAPAPHDSRGVGRWLPSVGWLDRDTDPVGRVARFDGAHGHHPGGSARHGSAGDRVARDLPDRICAQRRGGRPPRAFCDGGRRRGCVGGVRLGPGHQPGPSDRHGEAHARLGFACRRTSSRHSSLRSLRSWARCCSSIWNPTGTRRWNSAPWRKLSSAVVFSPCPGSRR